MIIVFWISCGIILYTYLVYPLAIAAIAKLCVSAHNRSNPNPVQMHKRVSVIMCARNEASRIAARLEDLCGQDYDSSLVEIIVVSDGSTDGTAEAVTTFRNEKGRMGNSPAIILIDKPVTCGKAAGLNDAVAASSSDILVMADARQRFGISDLDRQTISNLVASLANEDVGCTSGELYFVDAESGGLETDLGAYWRYEKWIRRNESKIDSVPGVTGAVYAMRRELFEELPPETLLDDVLVPLRAVLQGYRVIFDGSAAARDYASSSSRQEWRRKVRTLAGNWQLLNLVPQAFVPWRNRIWLQFISHKILRLIVPFALLAALASAFMIHEPMYRLFAILQLAFYSSAALVAIAPGLQRFRICSACYTFVLLNLAAIAGLAYWASGRSGNLWQIAASKQS